MTQSGIPLHVQTEVLNHLWRRLIGVHKLTFVATSNLGTAGWNGQGEGIVKCVEDGDVIVFHETGTWQTQEGQTLPFKNVFRWTRNQYEASVALEHLRFGPENSVFLFDLAGVSESELQSVQPHKCASDFYTGRLTLHRVGFDLLWQIEGPKKDEHILYNYR